MKYSQIILAAAMAAVAKAHATVWSIAVDGVDQGHGNSAAGYIRAPPNNNPLKDLTSTDLRCNVGGGTAVAKSISVKSGSKITVQWFHNGDSASDDIIDPSHKGPVMVYVAPAASNGAGNVWVKLAEEGYSGGKWAVDNLISNRGKHSFTIPAALAAGDYIFRPEIIASHESDTAYNVNPARGAQLYMACIQIKVTAGGSTPLPAGVAIPGVYSYSDPGILFNIYGGYTSYTIPGPKVWVPTGGASPAPATTLQTTTKAATPTTTKAPVVVAPTTTKAPVVVVPTTTKAPVVVVPTTTKAPVVVPTTTKAPVVVAPVTTSKIACPAATTKLITVVAPAPTAPASGGATATKYGQCGGIGFTGPKACVSGSTCTKQNDWYSQCL